MLVRLCERKMVEVGGCSVHVVSCWGRKKGDGGGGALRLKKCDWGGVVCLLSGL